MSRLNSNYRYWILCEDILMRTFIRAFLKACGADRHRIYVESLPKSGSGEQYVRETYPVLLSKLRAAGREKIALIVLTDSDNLSIAQRVKMLDAACLKNKQSVKSRQSNEHVAYFIPKRNMETWVKWYQGTSNVCEETCFKHFLNKHEADCKEPAKRMAEQFCNLTLPKNALPSILFAKSEYDDRLI